MKKLIYMGAGVMVGAAIVALMYNSKPITIYLRKCKNNMLVTLNSCMDELSMLIEEMDEEKVKQRLKTKYNSFKRKIEKIDFDNLEEDMKDMVNNLIDEIKLLINQTRNKELKEEKN